MHRTQLHGIAPPRLARQPWSARVCDWLVVFLGGWTLVCHLVVRLGGGLTTLLWTAGVALALASAGLLARRVLRTAPLAEELQDVPEAGPTEEIGLGFRPIHGAGLAVLAAPLFGAPPLVVWWLVVLYFLWALLSLSRTPAAEPHRSIWLEFGLWSLALVAALFTVTVHAHSPDDGYYINASVAAMDHPDEPLLARDTLHGTDAPIMYSVYRVHSHELLVAAVAKLLGRTAMRTAHAYLPFVFGFFVVLAFARLMRVCAPRRWLLATVVLILFLAVVNESPQYPGRFAFSRLQQGKSVFLSVLAPLLVCYAIDWMRRPGWRSFMLLALAQVACVGMTSTALWCAPAIAGLGLLGAESVKGSYVRRAGIGLLASLYPVVLGLAYRGDAVRQVGEEAAEGVRLVRIIAEPITEGAELVAATWSVAFGGGAFAVLMFAGLLFAWTTVRSSLSRRLLIALPLGAALFILNPYLAFPIARGVTGGITYWRALWVLPIPLFAALLLTRPCLRSRFLGSAATLAVTGAVLWCVPSRHFHEPTNGVSYRPFSLNIMVEPMRTAVAMRMVTDPGDIVLMAKGTSHWMPAFHKHPYPLVTRLNYLEMLTPYIGKAEVDVRRRLFEYVSGDSAVSEAVLFRKALRRFKLRAVTFRFEGEFAGEIRLILRTSGYTQVIVLGVNELWARG